MKLIPSSLLQFNKHKETWLWRPSCKNPKTLSFRAGDTMFKTVNSVFYDPKYSQHPEPEAELTTPDSCNFTNSSESASISTESEEYLNTNEYNSSLETIVRGVRSERLLFEPGPTTSSILEGKKQCLHVEIGGGGGGGGGGGDNNGGIPFKESVAMAIESEDPHTDFKNSMEEMVESHGLKDNWECLEELLGCYLRMNGKNHHEIIVGAFVDLLAGISGGRGGDGGTGGAASSSDHSTASFASVASTFTSAISFPLCKGGDEIEIIDEDKILINH